MVFESNQNLKNQIINGEIISNNEAQFCITWYVFYIFLDEIKCGTGDIKVRGYEISDAVWTKLEHVFKHESSLLSLAYPGYDIQL